MTTLGKKHTPEAKALIRERMRGNKNSAGRVVSIETRAKMRASQIGRKLPEEQRQRMGALIRAALKPWTPERRAAQAERMRKYHDQRRGIV